MKQPSVYLKMRVLGAVDTVEGRTRHERVHHVAAMTFLDEEGNPRQFTWRTIQTWYYRYKNHFPSGQSHLASRASLVPGSYRTGRVGSWHGGGSGIEARNGFGGGWWGSGGGAGRRCAISAPPTRCRSPLFSGGGGPSAIAIDKPRPPKRQTAGVTMLVRSRRTTTATVPRRRSFRSMCCRQPRRWKSCSAAAVSSACRRASMRRRCDNSSPSSTRSRHAEPAFAGPRFPVYPIRRHA